MIQVKSAPTLISMHVGILCIPQEEALVSHPLNKGYSASV